jgi:hypothetical protein
MRKLPEKYITDHHLTPEHRKESEVIKLCQPCHDQIHAVFTNHELRESYNSAEELREAGRIQGFINWISDTKKVDIKVKESDDVRRWRSKK